MKSETKEVSSHALPFLLAGVANPLLGLSSLYWREFGELSYLTVISYRIFLSAIILALFICLSKQRHSVKNVSLNTILLHCMASLFIALNWGAFIWASINDQFLESGLGYLLAPFISIAIGAAIYHEAINRRKTILILIALTSILALITLTKNLSHWTYLLIATTWSTYTQIKKITPLDAINGLFIETLFLATGLTLAITCLGFPVTLPWEFAARVNHLIWLAGAVSTLPLLMFSYATQKIQLSHTGILQLILPITLTGIALISSNHQSSDASLVLIITITGALMALIAYDIKASQRPKKARS